MTFRDTPNMFNRITKSEKSQNRQKLMGRVITIAFLTQAIIIGIKGNLDVLSGKPALNVLPWMITQAIELIVKVNRTQKSIEESDRPSQPRITPNSDD